MKSCRKPTALFSGLVAFHHTNSISIGPLPNEKAEHLYWQRPYLVLVHRCAPGTVIQYNVTDSVGTHINSTALTVQPNPLLSSASLLSISSTQSLASVSSVSIISTSSTGAPTSTHSNPSSTLSRTSNSPSPTRTSSGGRSNTRIIAGAVGVPLLYCSLALRLSS
ncbi:uncharacterized protein EI90DRAFT_1029287 [Cantharellus anzutake]|uniref:uncharacterized protein n=1 Tax=Cantharellus anzutake TaxID=1750568 RepID=UPI001905F68D|nr:uncharacterized protein EI90DRAFT_1029287 [Cantharellus anzutake]KAF8331519.1 hypothetical protein EI90DRAFT_1029287 [Cantharellus anzutake]